MKNKKTCEWPGTNALMQKYHDNEWGVPVHDDQKLFEFLVLDAFQAGLSWQTILNKRENFRKALHNFNANKISKYTQKDINRLLQNEGIIRNKLKIKSTITNAQQFLKLQKENGSFDKYIWQFTNHKTIHNKHKSIKDIPATSPHSDAMSKDLKSKGFRFVGSTICYAFMQAAGMVNDHTLDCYRHRELK
jgi:DNA-3-methyladenine glycosylase I